MGLEVWAFEIATLFSGRLGTVELGAHVVVLTLASLTFMVPLGISMGAVTRVGNLIGEGRRDLAQVASWMALVLGASAMAVAAVLFVLLRGVLPRVYTEDSAVIAAAASILPVAAAFQIFDGTQVVGTGILRAMGRTRPAAAFNLVGYYGLALPLAYWLAFRGGFGLPGIWWGLVLGLAAIAVMLVIWVWRRGPAHVASTVRLDAPREQPANP
jgi:MATE family multidrug resistance protein